MPNKVKFTFKFTHLHVSGTESYQLTDSSAQSDYVENKKNHKLGKNKLILNQVDASLGFPAYMCYLCYRVMYL